MHVKGLWVPAPDGCLDHACLEHVHVELVQDGLGQCGRGCGETGGILGPGVHAGGRGNDDHLLTIGHHSDLGVVVLGGLQDLLDSLCDLLGVGHNGEVHLSSLQLTAADLCLLEACLKCS